MRMRDLLEAPADDYVARLGKVEPRVLGDAFQVIEYWVTRGPVADQEFDRVWATLPRPKGSLTLWRVHTITAEQADGLSTGIALPVHRYMSWTTSEKAVRRLAMERAKDGIAAIIRMPIRASTIAVTIEPFINACLALEEQDPVTYDFSIGDMLGFEHEAESIVRHDAPLKLNRSNTTLFTVEHTGPEPKVGEQVFEPGSEDGYAITQVRGRDKVSGAWVVDTTNDENLEVMFMAAGEWESLQRYGDDY